MCSSPVRRVAQVIVGAPDKHTLSGMRRVARPTPLGSDYTLEGAPSYLLLLGRGS